MKYCRCGNHKQLLAKLNFFSYSSNERTKCSQTKFNFNWSGNFFLSVSFSLCLRPILLVNYCRDSVDVKHNSMQCVEIESEITGETSHGWKWMVFGVRSWRALAIKINKFLSWMCVCFGRNGSRIGFNSSDLNSQLEQNVCVRLLKTALNAQSLCRDSRFCFLRLLRFLCECALFFSLLALVILL